MCSDAAPAVGGATPEEIGMLTDQRRLGLILLCEGDDRLTSEQRAAIEANDIISEVLDAAGLARNDVLAAQSVENGALVLYVRVPA
jgi:hypothetical protein